ncbi:MAG: hypothetical protein HYZ57_08180 [Acidobacteria bacterium]|nr:hypothetical protein [Acidobacteriota bacterium]MBI3279802.1 hypothetical protein [Acidobacteriota bacterium]
MAVLRCALVAALPVCAAFADAGIEPVSPVPEPAAVKTRFDWQAATAQSFRFLAIEHSFRLIQGKTRCEFGGKFLHDYYTAVSNIHGWGDGDGIFTNYIAHPMQGAVAGFIQIQNDPSGRRAEFGDELYWRSRLRAFLWSATYSTQFEIGLVSEATIGNVGMNPGTAGAVDLVMTPSGGIGLIFMEDAIDRYLVRRLENRASTPVRKAFIRSALNPHRAFANLLRGKPPWHRDTRPGLWTAQP